MLLGRADQVALRCGDQTVRYGELAAAVESLAGGLIASGFRAGDRLALFMPNCPELVVAYLACFRTGVIAVPLNTRYRAPEVNFALTRSRASTVIVHPELASEAAEAPAQQWLIGEPGGAWETALHGTAQELASPIPEAPAVILFTSGSTSQPKGVTHAHASMRHTITVQAESQELRDDDVNLITLATCHIAGLFGQLLPTLASGGTCILHPHFDAGLAASEIERSRVTRIQLLPGQLAELLEVASERGCRLQSLRCAIAGGDAVAPDTQRRFRDLTGLEITEVCGMTECFDYAMNPPVGEKRLGSIGRPAPGNELRLRGADGREPPTDKPGEILVRSRSTMLGYWDDPEQTAAALADGWLHTGDIARCDADGWFWFVGRSKELIIRGGSNVAPGEVEAVLHMHPAVAASVVVGVPDPKLGQRIAAWVQPAHGAPAGEAELRAFVRSQIADYKAPEWILFTPALPTTAVGKFDRTALQREAATRLAGR